MNVKIIEIKTNSEVKSKISLVTKNKDKLPSIHEGWRFNFSKHSNGNNYETYILTTLSSPDIIEGCLIINSNAPNEVYMAFVEVAPHNRGNGKKYDKVAGCLIAF